MNVNKNAIRILCYGDSNTWGRSGQDTRRYPVDVRWTGLLQEKLGSSFEIIEEGLRSRTTDLDDDDPQFPGRNGLTYLRPCLESHNPLDIVVLWLGTNDLKSKFHRSAEDITKALEILIEEIKLIARSDDGRTAKILLISPPIIKEEVLKTTSQFAGAGNKSKEFSSLIKKLSEKSDCAFLDLAEHVEPGDFDGVHLEAEAHVVVAEKIHEGIKKICQ
jgi:lysophospholipase L1-like esterase